MPKQRNNPICKFNGGVGFKAKCNIPIVKRLFWDIEVSPNVVLAFAAGYDKTINHDAIVAERKIICIGYKWENETQSHVLVWDKNQDDRELIEKFLAVAEDADELVAHFGDRFDLPWFIGRCIILGFPPLPKFKTVDTKKLAASNCLFNSNKLDYLAAIFGFGHKDKMEFSDWKEILMNKNPAALAKMVKYCARDVHLLEAVYKRLSVHFKPKTHAGVYAGMPKWSCTHCGSTAVAKSKTRVTAAGSLQHQMRCVKCGSYSTISDAAFREYQKES